MADQFFGFLPFLRSAQVELLSSMFFLSLYLSCPVRVCILAPLPRSCAGYSGMVFLYIARCTIAVAEHIYMCVDREDQARCKEHMGFGIAFFTYN